MTVGFLLLISLVTMTSCWWSDEPSRLMPENTGAPAAMAGPPTRREVSFEEDILPILSEGCRPCHFEGGKMYEKLPFERPETIRKLGERLFTRIRNERERAVVRAFLRTPDRAP